MSRPLSRRDSLRRALRTEQARAARPERAEGAGGTGGTLCSHAGCRRRERRGRRLAVRAGNRPGRGPAPAGAGAAPTGSAGKPVAEQGRKQVCTVSKKKKGKGADKW